MALHQSGEDYLEAILLLRQQKGVVRSIDIAQYLGYSKPSISRAMSLLKSSGHIVMEDGGHITLTSQGEVIAQQIYQRHLLLKDFLERLGVSAEVAAEDACKMEHYISDETYQCLKHFVEDCKKINPDQKEGDTSCLNH